MTVVELTITTPYDAMLVMSELHRRTIDEVRLDREWHDAFRRRQELGRRAAKRIVRDARARAVDGWPHNHHGVELRLGTHGRERGAVIYQVASFCSLDWCNRPVEWPQRTYCSKHKDPRKRRQPIGWMSQLEEAELAGYAPIEPEEYEQQLARLAKRCECSHYLAGPDARRRPDGWEPSEWAPLTWVYRDGATLICMKCAHSLPKPFRPSTPRLNVSTTGAPWASVGDGHPFEEPDESDDDVVAFASRIEEHALADEGLVIQYGEPEDL